MEKTMKKPTKKSLLKKIDKQERDITKLISERNVVLFKPSKDLKKFINTNE